jgi:cob(I)alamin adenosyltransferase
MDYNSMSKIELEAMLKRLQNNLEDLEETINFNFTYSAAHIGSSQVRKDEEILKKLKEEIERIKEILIHL